MNDLERILFGSFALVLLGLGALDRWDLVGYLALATGGGLMIGLMIGLFMSMKE